MRHLKAVSLVALLPLVSFADGSIDCASLGATPKIILMRALMRNEGAEDCAITVLKSAKGNEALTAELAKELDVAVMNTARSESMKKIFNALKASGFDRNRLSRASLLDMVMYAETDEDRDALFKPELLQQSDDFSPYDHIHRYASAGIATHASVEYVMSRGFKPDDLPKNQAHLLFALVSKGLRRGAKPEWRALMNRVLETTNAFQGLLDDNMATYLIRDIVSPGSDVAALKLALSRGARLKEPYLLNYAAKNPDPEVLELVLKIAPELDVNFDTKGGHSPLAVAVGERVKKNFALLLEKGADVRFKAQDGKSLLDIALQHSNSKEPEANTDLYFVRELVKRGLDPKKDIQLSTVEDLIGRVPQSDGFISFLMESGYDFNQRNPQGQSLLASLGSFDACGKSKHLDALLAKIDVNDLDHSQRTPLFCILQADEFGPNRRDCAMKLIEKGADPWKGAVPAFSVLIQRESDPQIIDLAARKAPKGALETYLHDYLREVINRDRFSLGVVEALLKNGADPNRQLGGYTALDIAVERRRASRLKQTDMLVELLRRYGAKFHVYDETHAFPFRLEREITEREFKKQINIKSSDGWTALHSSMMDAPNEGVKKLGDHPELLKHINAKTKSQNETPLHIAALTRKMPMVLSLLKNGAKPEVQDIDGNTFLHHLLAKHYYPRTHIENGVETFRYPEILKLLQENPGLLKIKNKRGYSVQDYLEICLREVADEQIDDRSYEDVRALAAKYRILVRKARTSSSALQTDKDVADAVELLGRRALGSKGKFPPPLPLQKEATEEQRAIHKKYEQAYRNMETSIKRPYDITAGALDLESMPPVYYEAVIKAGQTLESNVSRKFNPSKDQALRVARIMLEHEDTSQESMEKATWLLSRAGVSFDESVLSAFKFNEDELLKTATELISTEPGKYRKTSPELAALQLYKAFEIFSKRHPLTCSKNEELGAEWLTLDPTANENQKLLRRSGFTGGGGSLSFPSRLMIWLPQLAIQVHDGALPRKKFFAQLIELLLSKHNLCASERNTLLSDLHRWRAQDATVQKELLCSFIAAKAQGPISTTEFSSMLLAANTLGVNESLTPAAFYETVSTYDALKDEDKPLIHLGLLRYILGHPEGRLFPEPEQRNPKGELLSALVNASGANKGSVKKLCAMVNAIEDARKTRAVSSTEEDFIAGSRKFVADLKELLEAKRQYNLPGSKFKSATQGLLSAPQEQTLRQIFAEQRMDSDLKAIESNCGSVTQRVSPEPSKSAPRSTKLVRPRVERPYLNKKAQ